MTDIRSRTGSRRSALTSIATTALPLFSAVVLALSLTGCYTQLGTVASSQSTSGETTTHTVADANPLPSSDASGHTSSATVDTSDAVDDFFQDFDHYALKYLDSSDRALVKRATRLLEERSNSEISQATYRDRLNNFRTDHPDFYGNFFGDPFYATYDLQYTRLAELRQRINTFVNPQNSVRSTASFYCSPFSYDPNFGGVCRGFQYAASDFFFLPSGSFSPSLPPNLSSRSDVTFAQVYGPSSRPSLMGYEAGNGHHRPVAEANRPSTAPVLADNREERAHRDSKKKSNEGTPPLSPDSPSDDRAEKLRIPSEVQPLSGREIASLTESLREGLSPQEQNALVRHLSTLRAGQSGMSSPQHRTVRDDLSLHVETIRRAARGQLYGSRSSSRGLTAGQSDAPLSDVSSSELLDRLDRRRGRRAGSGTYSTADRSTRSSDRARRSVGRSIRTRGESGTDSSSSGQSSTVDQSDDSSSSSSGRTGRDSGDSDR